jgi:hypothetical protein
MMLGLGRLNNLGHEMIFFGWIGSGVDMATMVDFCYAEKELFGETGGN